MSKKWRSLTELLGANGSDSGPDPWIQKSLGKADIYQIPDSGKLRIDYAGRKWEPIPLRYEGLQHRITEAGLLVLQDKDDYRQLIQFPVNGDDPAVVSAEDFLSLHAIPEMLYYMPKASRFQYHELRCRGSDKPVSLVYDTMPETKWHREGFMVFGDHSLEFIFYDGRKKIEILTGNMITHSALVGSDIIYNETTPNFFVQKKIDIYTGEETRSRLIDRRTLAGLMN